MRRVLAAGVVAALLALAVGCGEDPFVGTWRTSDPSMESVRLVIEKPSDGYRAFFVSEKPKVTMGPFAAQRSGYELAIPDLGVVEQTLTYDPDSGHLTLKTVPEATGLDFKLVSRSTSHPPVASPQSSPDQSF